jgi:hypothetical protein
VCVECLFLRQKGDLPGPPPRSPSPRMSRPRCRAALTRRALPQTPPLVSESPLRSLVCDGQTSSQRPRLVVSRSTRTICSPLSPSPHANSFVIGTAVINAHSPLLVQVKVPPSQCVCLLLQYLKIELFNGERSKGR